MNQLAKKLVFLADYMDTLTGIVIKQYLNGEVPEGENAESQVLRAIKKLNEDKLK